jgi:hypothetical protein
MFKSALDVIKHWLDDIHVVVSFLNSSNHCIANFKRFCVVEVRPRKFGSDMDVRWNSTYLTLKHLLPYKNFFFSLHKHQPF